MNNKRVTVPVKAAFGIGQIAEGAKNCAISIFLIFFYTNVLGLSGTLAGTALLIALCFDGISDPLMGSISDSFKSRWGRRHPFMYGSAIPMAVSFYFLFVPPAGLSQTGLFIWLTVFAVLTRTFMTAYSVPHMAMNAELTEDYGERTTLSSVRVFCGMLGFLIVAVVSFSVFFKATPEFAKGQLNPAAYPRFALTFAILIVVTIWYSAIGTHHRIPFLPQPSKDTPRLSLNRFITEMVSTFKVRPFRFMASGMVFWYVIYGLYQGMILYLCTYFWGFSSKQIGIILPISLLGTFSVVFARKVARIVGEKRDTWIYASIWSGVAGGIPLFLRLFHLLPENDHPIIFPLVAASFFLCQTGFAITLAMGHSILADITDEHERVHHVRQEGLYYGVISLMQKIATGLGSFVTGLIVDFSGIGSLKDPSTIPWETLARFGWCLVAVPTVVNVIAILFVLRYDISRARHAEILEELAHRKTDSAAVTS
jgi:Na+/melibiose symporter-like transporter